MGERYNIHSQLEHLQSKYIGTGHADTTKFEWVTNQHRDTYASYMGHFDMMNYFAIAENESKARVKWVTSSSLFQSDLNINISLKVQLYGKNGATMRASAREKVRGLAAPK